MALAGVAPLILGLAVSFPGRVDAACTITGGSTSTNTSSAYAQNQQRACVDTTAVTVGAGSTSGYGYAGFASPQIAYDSSIVLRWSNWGDASGNLGLSIADGASLTSSASSGLNRPLVYLRTGYYLSNSGTGTPTNTNISPDNRAIMTINNNGTINNQAASGSSLSNLAAAVGFDADDAPVDEYFVNGPNGVVKSASAWGVIVRNAHVLTLGQVSQPSDNIYSYNNIIHLENNGVIDQTGSATTAQSGLNEHSAALAVWVGSAKDVSVVVNKNASIKGIVNGVDMGTSTYVTSSTISNAGYIYGGSHGINIDTSNLYIIAGLLNGSTSYPAYVTSITNASSGEIGSDGTAINIGTTSTLEGLYNYGLISGASYAIDNEGTITDAIYNYGTLNGNSYIGDATLNILGKYAVISGDLTGNASSVVNIGAAGAPASFTSANNAQVGSIVNFAGSFFGLADDAKWYATSGASTSVANYGTLSLGNGAILGGNVSNYGEIALPAQNGVVATIDGNFTGNASRINMANGYSGDTLNITGDYTSGGNIILIDSYLTNTGTVAEGGSTTTDKLSISGNTIDNGQDFVAVNNLGTSLGSGTESVQVVQVGGASSAASFALKNRVVSGAYEYLLNKHNDGDWYLESVAYTPPRSDIVTPTNTASATSAVESPVRTAASTTEPVVTTTVPTRSPSKARTVGVIRPETGAYAANVDAASTMFNLTWFDRVGASRLAGTARQGMWMRVDGLTGSRSIEQDQLETDYRLYRAQLGLDLWHWSTNGRNDIVFGLMAGYGKGGSRNRSDVTGYRADSDLEGYDVGTYGSWTQNGPAGRGFYVDSWALFSRYDAEIAGEGLDKQHYDLSNLAASLETGYSLDVARTDLVTLWLQPQTQVILSDLNSDDLTDSRRIRISSDGEGLKTRLGLRASLRGNAPAASGGFAQIDWLHNERAPRAELGDYKTDVASNALKLGMGYQYQANAKMGLGIELNYLASDQSDHAMGASGRVNYRF